jgi:hypothetical protein
VPAQRTSVEHCDPQSGLNQHPGGGSSGGARSDDHDIINRRANGSSSLLAQHKDNPFRRPEIASSERSLANLFDGWIEMNVTQAL